MRLKLAKKCVRLFHMRSGNAKITVSTFGTRSHALLFYLRFIAHSLLYLLDIILIIIK